MSSESNQTRLSYLSPSESIEAQLAADRKKIRDHVNTTEFTTALVLTVTPLPGSELKQVKGMMVGELTPMIALDMARQLASQIEWLLTQANTILQGRPEGEDVH